MRTTLNLFCFQDYRHCTAENLVTAHQVIFERTKRYNLRRTRLFKFIQVCSKYKLYTEQVLPLVNTERKVYTINKKVYKRLAYE